MYRRSGVIYRPITWTYLILLMISTLTIILIINYTVPILIKGLMIPPQWAVIIFYASLFGSLINVPLTSMESGRPIVRRVEINVFGVKWYLPEMEIGFRRTIIAINVGGAIIPTILSLYLLTYTIPRIASNPMMTYIKIAVSLLIVAITVNRNAKIIPKLGIALPGLLPPLITTITALIISYIPPQCNPAIIAYVSGTLGTLIGADLMNLNKIAEIEANMVSIGGAGTFDGIYLTGIIATALTILTL